QTFEGRRPPHEGRVVALARSRHGRPVLRAQKDVARSAANGLGEGVARDVLDAIDPQALRLRPSTLVDPERGVLADQHDDARARGAKNRGRGSGVAKAPDAGSAVRFVRRKVTL